MYCVYLYAWCVSICMVCIYMYGVYLYVWCVSILCMVCNVWCVSICMVCVYMYGVSLDVWCESWCMVWVLMYGVSLDVWCESWCMVWVLMYGGCLDVWWVSICVCCVWCGVCVSVSVCVYGVCRCSLPWHEMRPSRLRKLGSPNPLISVSSQSWFIRKDHILSSEMLSNVLLEKRMFTIKDKIVFFMYIITCEYNCKSLNMLTDMLTTVVC